MLSVVIHDMEVQSCFQMVCADSMYSILFYSILFYSITTVLQPLSVGLLGRGSASRKACTYTQNNTQNKCTQTSMPGVAFEPTTPVFERTKTVHALYRTATVMGGMRRYIPANNIRICNRNI
jgi:hypothetical protein